MHASIWQHEPATLLQAPVSEKTVDPNAIDTQQITVDSSDAPSPGTVLDLVLFVVMIAYVQACGQTCLVDSCA